MSQESKAEKIEGIINALSASLPKFIDSIVNEFYSPESAGKIGRGLAEYYKALKEGGIPETTALEMVKSYASNLTFKGMGHVCGHMSPWGMMGMAPGMGVGRGMMGRMMHHMKIRHGEGAKDEEQPDE